MKSIRIVCLLLILAITAAWAPAPGLTAAPAAPTSLTPATGLVIPNKTITSLAVTFSWAHATATRYQFQLSKNSTFTNLVDLGSEPLTDKFITTTLLPNTRYWFRVRAYVNDVASAYTAARYISTLPEEVAFAASPVIGDDNLPPVLDTLRPTLDWDDEVLGAKTFELQVFLASDNVASATPKYSKIGIPATQTQFTLPISLAENTTYKWRVRSRGTYGVPPWFGPGDPSGAGGQFFKTPDLPATPVLLLPSTGKIFPATPFIDTFTWKPVVKPAGYPEGILTYELQITTDKTFNTITYGGGTIVTIEPRYAMAEQEPVVPFTTGTYYWRVRARLAPGGGIASIWYSPWTAARILKTQPRLQGVVLDDFSGEPVEGATVTVGTLKTTTGADGAYVFETIPAGARSVVITKTDYTKKTVSTTLVAGAVRQLDIKLAKLPYRIVLTWGANPRDLDANLWLPADQWNLDDMKAHVRSNLLGSTTAFPYARKNLDDLNGYGPETVTIQKRFAGKYVYAVYLNQFSSWAISKAVVKVYKGTSTTPAYVFNVPTNNPIGRWWHVFDLDGDTGVIDDKINAIKDDTEFCTVVYDCLNGEAELPE